MHMAYELTSDASYGQWNFNAYLTVFPTKLSYKWVQYKFIIKNFIMMWFVYIKSKLRRNKLSKYITKYNKKV